MCVCRVTAHRPDDPSGSNSALGQARQHDQYHRDGYGATDARRDLSEGHQLHPICGSQNGNVSSAALAAVASIDDGRLDRIHIEEPAHDGADSHQCHDGAEDRNQIGNVECRDQLIPRRERNADGKQERISDGGREELVDHHAALLEMG